MKLTQGCFSFLPDLTDEQISKQIAWAIRKSWAVSIEFTDDPHPRNSYWEMWGLPSLLSKTASVDSVTVADEWVDVDQRFVVWPLM